MGPVTPVLPWRDCDVLVVVVTYRGGPLLTRCLDSLAAQSGPRHRVLVVDNGGTAETRGPLAGRELTVVEPGSNTGFAGGANVGLRAAARAWAAGHWPDGLVVLLNDDAEAQPGMLAAFVEAAAAAGSEVGALAGLLLLDDGAADPAAAGAAGATGGGPRVNSTGTVITRRGSARDRDAGRPLAEVAEVAEVFGFCGGCVALPARVLAEVGVFADDWFLYYEDVDLAWRLRARGLTVRHVRTAVARHAVGASAGDESAVFRFHNDRNSLLTFARHAPAAVALRVWLRFPAAVVAHLLRRRTRPLVATRWRALGAACRRLPRTLAERRTLWRDAAQSRRAVAARWLDAER